MNVTGTLDRPHSISRTGSPVRLGAAEGPADARGPIGLQRLTVAASSQLRLQLLSHLFTWHSLAECVASTNDLVDVVPTCRIAEPDVLVLCANADETEDVLSVVRTLTREQPSVRVILLVTGATSQLSRALAAGVSGYLTEAVGVSELERAIRTVAMGRKAIDSTAIGTAVRGLTRPAQTRQAKSASLLTPRETDVLRLLAEGTSTVAMAHQLRISVHTTRTHLKNILRKLDARTRVQAAALAVERALI